MMVPDEEVGFVEPAALYLFSSSSSIVEFVVPEEEMRQLNDFCAMCQEQVEGRLLEFNSQLGRYQSREDRLIVEPFNETSEHHVDPVAAAWAGTDVTDDAIMALTEFDIPTWEHTHSVIMPAMCLLLLASFEEKTLKWLCLRLSPYEKTDRINNIRNNKINEYMKFLAEECALSFTEPPEATIVRKQFRQVRNAFAHGDWEDIEPVLTELSLPDAFWAVSELFRVIEAAKYPDR
jgi:hypothetical protein